MSRVYLILILFHLHFLKATPISADTALLIDLVTNTAAQLNELEKLVTNAEKYTQKMQHYNEIVQDQYFKTERALYLAEDIAAKRDIENLGDVNDTISNLKNSFEEIKIMMKEYDLIQKEDDKTKIKVERLSKLEDRKNSIAKSQVQKSASANSVGRANQLTAQNTALIYESQVDIHKTQLEILKNISKTNKLLADDLKDKKMKDVQKMKSYKTDKK